MYSTSDEKTFGQVLLVQKEKGGIVGNWHTGPGHESVEQLFDLSLP